MARDDQIYTRFYESARAEIIQRIALRDHALIVYVAVIGGYLAFVIHEYGFKYEAATACESVVVNFPLPIICLLFTFVIISHHSVINSLGAYLRFEWQRNIENENKNKNENRDERFLHWDNCQSLVDQGKFVQLIRTLAQCLALCVPFVFEGFIYVENFVVLNLQCASLAVLQVMISLCCLGCVIWVHLYVHMARANQLHLLRQDAHSKRSPDERSEIRD